jgi:large subunit ribosomal protein L25
MEVDGKSEKVLLRDFQMHAFKPLVLHADFQRVDPNQKIHMKVPLHFINAEIAPAIKLSGGIISHVMNEIDISCLPKDLPAFVEVDLSNMQVNTSFHVADLKLPAGVVAVHAKDNPTIATATVPGGSKADEPAAAAEEKPVRATGFFSASEMTARGIVACRIIALHTTESIPTCPYV